ncbi:MAG: helix-hairpin-helix domain-containing protein [Gammaproteobacteria bacterium]|nr:helix-hairpin-helix domain-containing protein [Gammaproteobacteria bacterium]
MKKFISAILLALTLVSQTGFAKDKEMRVTAEQTIARVNINTASADQLATSLKGVGLKKAQAIIEYRKEYGDFKSVNELTAVKGIGEKTLAKNRDKIGL